MKLQDLYHLRWRYVQRACLSYLCGLDDLGYKPAPADLVGSVGIMFLLSCERFKLDPREVLNVCDRILKDATQNDPNAPRGLREYLKKELRDV